MKVRFVVVVNRETGQYEICGYTDVNIAGKGKDAVYTYIGISDQDLIDSVIGRMHDQKGNEIHIKEIEI
jgi:hypothetical protein